MPRIPQEITDCVFYLYRQDETTGEVVGPCGTGFIVAVISEGETFFYAVTNWHVAVRDGASIIRLNRSDGSTRLIEADPSEWTFMPDGDDLALLEIDLDHELDRVSYVEARLLITPTFIDRYSVGFGEDVFMIGLFVGHDGGDQNVPKGRFGNISMMASDLAPVEMPNGVVRPCHIIDLRSRTGFSGSPVFAYRTPTSDLTAFEDNTDGDKEWQIDPENNIFLRCLGVHCSQFLEPLEVRKLREGAGEAAGDPVREGERLAIQSSMTAVIPAWRINELLEHPKLVEQRKKKAAKGGVVLSRPDAESVDPNSFGKDEAERRFRAALKSAVNTPPMPLKGKRRP